jgi:hypothetical protein
MFHATLLALTLAQLPAGPAPWRLDEITRTNGAKLVGLILDDSAAGVRFQVVNRSPGRPTVTFTTTVFPNEIAGIKKLADADRALLRERLADLDPKGVGERQRMDALDLKPADWLGRPGAAKRYDSDHFVLVSSAPEEITRRAAVRLEQIYTAYSRFLPPRHAAGRPTTVLLAPDPAEYRELVGPVLNPAVFDPAANRIVLGTNLRRLGEELNKVRLYHEQQLATLKKYEDDLRKLYKQPAELERHLRIVREERGRIAKAEKENDAAFDKAAQRPFALLYHESFHAYASNFAFPAATGELPRWLNEGLAQIFETAILEAGELRVGHADADRLGRAQSLLKAGRLVPITELLKAGKESFVALHADQKAASDRTYVTAWVVAFHLTFEKRLLGTERFDAYVSAASRGDPVPAFEALVGGDAAGYEAELYAYLEKLMASGAGRK